MLQVQEIKLSKLHPWEDNPRLNDHAVDAVAESIRSFGFNVPILCDQNLTIIAGHTRWKAAIKLGMNTVPVIVVEMTDAQRRAFAVADNKTAEIADWDFPKLKEVLEELTLEDVDIKSLGFSDEEIIPRNFHIMRNSCYYPALEWEALLVYQKPGNIPKMTREGRDYMSKYHTDVWEIPAVTNQVEQYGHPAVCPVEIPFRSIQAYTGSQESLFEPFGGSGTTLIAAEKASRKAYLMELNPAYCDVIIHRWEGLTGNKAVLIANDKWD